MDPERTPLIENHPFDEIAIGEAASLQRTLSADDLALFAAMSGDLNPTHIDAEFARSTELHEVIAHGMWCASLISNVLGTQFPGPGTVYVSQTLDFIRPAHLGDLLTVTVRCIGKDPLRRHVLLDCRCDNQNGEMVVTGVAVVRAPGAKVKRARRKTPDCGTDLPRPARAS